MSDISRSGLGRAELFDDACKVGLGQSTLRVIQDELETIKADLKKARTQQEFEELQRRVDLDNKRSADAIAKRGSVSLGEITVDGPLPRDVIDRVVREKFGRFRDCYEKGLGSNPGLQGGLTVRFVIGRSGGVSYAGYGTSSLPDAGVVSCVTAAFGGLSFPSPEGGVVTVVCPLVFAPPK